MNDSEQELLLKKDLEKEVKKALKNASHWEAMEVIQKADKECIVLDEHVILNSGIPLFLISLMTGNTEVSKYIIDNYSKPQKDLSDVYNPMSCAIREGQIEIIDALEKKGFSINQIIKDGNSAFMLNCNPYPKMSLSSTGIEYVLKHMKPNLLLTNKKGQNALDIMEQKASSETHLIALLKEKTLEQKEHQKITNEHARLNEVLQPIEDKKIVFKL